jgi:DNA-binding MarR family transcriptional regulator
MSESGHARGWHFVTSHGQVLLCLARDPDARLKDVAAVVGITERAVQRILADLVEAGYVERERTGRRNRYTIRADLPLPDALARNQRVGDLLAVLSPDA